jgi:hypothetical protein
MVRLQRPTRANDLGMLLLLGAACAHALPPIFPLEDLDHPGALPGAAMF